MILTKEDAQLIFGAMLMSMGPKILSHIKDDDIADAPDFEPTLAQYRSMMTRLNAFLVETQPAQPSKLILPDA